MQYLADLLWRVVYWLGKLLGMIDKNRRPENDE